MANRSNSTLLRHIRMLATQADVERLSDRELLKRFTAERDQAAFANLMRRHGPMVHGVCRRVLRQAQDAEDVFQATFLVLAQKSSALRWQESVGNWLHGVAYRLALKVKTRAAKRNAKQSRVRQPPVNDLLDEVTVREAQTILDEELARLPENYRAPIVLCCLEGKARDEAARHLGWPMGLVKARLEEGRKRLRRRLIRRGFTLAAGLTAVLLAEGVTPAAVPVALADSTVRAALLFAARSAPAAGLVSAEVAALVKEATKAMLVTKLKTVKVLLLAASLIAAGAGVLAQRRPAIQPAPQLPTDSAKAKDDKADPPRLAAEKQDRTDRYGDPLPPGAIARLGTMRLRHADTIHQVSLSPDGKVLAAAGMTYNFYLWDVATGRVKRREHRGAGRAVAFSSDGKTLASGGQGEVLVWDSVTGKELRRFQVKTEMVTRLIYSPDDKTVACLGHDNTVHLLDLATGKERCQWEGPPNYIPSSVAFSPDARTLAIAHKKDSVIRLYDTATGPGVRQFLRPRDHIQQGDYIHDVAFSPDGKTLVSSFGSMLHFYELATGKEVRKVEPGGYVKTLLFSPDGRSLVLGGFDIRLWEVASSKTVAQFKWERGVGSVACVALSANGKIVAASMDDNTHTVALWDVATGKRLHDFEGHVGGVHAVAFSPDGRLLATGAGERNLTPDNRVRLWKPSTGEPLRELGQGLGLVYSISFSPDGQVLAASNEDGTIRFLDRDTGKELRRLVGHRGLITSIAFSADGKNLASRGYDRTIRIWDVAAGKERNSFPGNQDQHGSIALSPDGKVVAEGAYGDRTVRLWDAATGREVRRFEGFQAGSVVAAFSPDGKLLAVGGQHGAGDELRLYETATGKEVQRFPGDQQGTHLVVFSPDGRSLAAVSADSVVHLWEVATGKLRGRFLGYGEVFLSAAFSPDGRFLALGTAEATAYVFDVMWLGRDGRPQRGSLTEKDLQALWADLACEDAAKAFSAVCALATAPQEAVRFVQQHLRPVPPLEAAQRKQVSQWIEDLGSDQFAVRQKGSGQLEKVGEPAYPALRSALEGKTSLETRRRLEQLLQRLEGWTPERLRGRRALEVLEYIDTPQARKVLQGLAAGSPEARLTQEAKSALQRLRKHTRVTR